VTVQLGEVQGTATATVKHASMNGWKIDRCGAGRGERVIITSDGAGTRALVGSENTPVRWSVLGIVDAE
jgi:ethanolamine utilization protein EutN